MSKGLTALTATAFIDMLGFAVVFPLLPFFARELGASPFMIGIMISSFSISQLAMSPIWGRVSTTTAGGPCCWSPWWPPAWRSSSSAWRTQSGCCCCHGWCRRGRRHDGSGAGLRRRFHDAAGTGQGVGLALVGDERGRSVRGRDRRGRGPVRPCDAGIPRGRAVLRQRAVRVARAAGIAAQARRAQALDPRVGLARTASSARAPARLIWIYAVGMGAFAAMSSCVALYLAIASASPSARSAMSSGTSHSWRSSCARDSRQAGGPARRDEGHARRGVCVRPGAGTVHRARTIPMFAVVLPLIPSARRFCSPRSRRSARTALTPRSRDR